MLNKYGKVRYIKNYCDAPKSAEFIFRRLYDGTWVLQRYRENFHEDIIFFDSNACSTEVNFAKTLEHCRKLINSKKIIWVERPFWKMPLEVEFLNLDDV